MSCLSSLQRSGAVTGSAEVCLLTCGVEVDRGRGFDTCLGLEGRVILPSSNCKVELDSRSTVRTFRRFRTRRACAETHLFPRPSVVAGARRVPPPREGRPNVPNQREPISHLSLFSETVISKTSLNLSALRKEEKRSRRHSVGGRFWGRSAC